MKTARRNPVEPSTKFARMLTKAKQSGTKLIADEITIIPPPLSHFDLIRTPGLTDR